MCPQPIVQIVKYSLDLNPVESHDTISKTGGFSFINNNNKIFHS